MSKLLEILYTILVWTIDIIKYLAEVLFSWFMRLTLPEKVILLNGFLAVLAVILPAAEYHIFGAYKDVSYKHAVYMVGVAFYMFATIFFKGAFVLYSRILVNLYYLFWAIYIPLFEGLTKAEPYRIHNAYYLHYAVPVIYMLFSVLSYYNDRLGGR